MNDHPNCTASGLFLTPEERTALSPSEERLIHALTHYFQPHELALLTPEDLAFFLSLEQAAFPDVSAQAAQRIAFAYRDRVRLKLGFNDCKL
jgi:hypothetical protein